jgi:hypothetical protein
VVVDVNAALLVAMESLLSADLQDAAKVGRGERDVVLVVFVVESGVLVASRRRVGGLGTFSVANDRRLGMAPLPLPRVKAAFSGPAPFG